jgi:hypothetical protein
MSILCQCLVGCVEKRYRECNIDRLPEKKSFSPRENKSENLLEMVLLNLAKKHAKFWQKSKNIIFGCIADNITLFIIGKIER